MYKWVDRVLHRDTRTKHLAVVFMLAGALMSLLASFVLSVEALILARNSEAVLHCDINAAVSCTAVANHWSASLLGFPNSFIGLATLPVMVTVGVALLAGVKFPRWFMYGAQLGASMGLVFAAWMLYMSVFEIQILCPWCLTTDIGMLLIFYGITRYNVLMGIIRHPQAKKIIQGGYDLFVLALVIALIIIVILAKLNSQLF